VAKTSGIQKEEALTDVDFEDSFLRVRGVYSWYSDI
jgi:hypothetical protein